MRCHLRVHRSYNPTFRVEPSIKHMLMARLCRSMAKRHMLLLHAAVGLVSHQSRMIGGLDSLAKLGWAGSGPLAG